MQFSHEDKDLFLLILTENLDFILLSMNLRIVVSKQSGEDKVDKITFNIKKREERYTVVKMCDKDLNRVFNNIF